MSLEFLSFLVGLMIVPVLYFSVRKVFLEAKYLTFAFSGAGILGLLGLSQLNNVVGGRPNFYLFLLCPIYALIVLRILLFCFRKIKQRDPWSIMKIPNPFLSYDDGLWLDRIFHFVFMILTLCVPMFLLACYYP